MPLDFSLLRQVKDNVYKTPVTSLDELKLSIFAAIENSYTENAGKQLEGIEYLSDF
jgi:hypothetical protein